MSPSGPLLAIEDLSIALPRGADRPFAAQGVSFAIQPGEVVCLVGESGSGKSMIAHAILSLLPSGVSVSRGSIALRDENLLGLGANAQRRLRGGAVSMIFQEPLSSLNPLKRVGEQVAEAIAAHDATRSRSAVAKHVLYCWPHGARQALSPDLFPSYAAMSTWCWLF